MFQALNSWLTRVFIGSRGYTVYADGRMHRGAADSPKAGTVSLGSFRKVFGEAAELDESRFFVPSNPGTHSGFSGCFHIIDGQLAASAEFVWNRVGIQTSLLWVWLCLLSIGLDVLSGVIVMVQGNLTGGRAFVIALTLLALVLLMFLPRAVAELKEKLLYELRQPVIAKLSALVQHEGRSV